MKITREQAIEQLGCKKVELFWDETNKKHYWFNSETGEIYIPNKKSWREKAKEKYFDLNK